MNLFLDDAGDRMKEDEEYLDKLLKSIENPEESNKPDKKDNINKTENSESSEISQNKNKGDAKYTDQNANDNNSKLENVNLNNGMSNEDTEVNKEGKKEAIPSQQSHNEEETTNKVVNDPIIEEIAKEDLDQFADNFGLLNEHTHHIKRNNNKKEKKSFLFLLGSIFKKKDKVKKTKSKLKDKAEKSNSNDSDEAADDNAATSEDKDSNESSKSTKTKQKPNKKVKPKKNKVKKPKAVKAKKEKKKPKKIKKVKKAIIEEEDLNVKKLPKRSVFLIFLLCFSMLAFVFIATYTVSQKNATDLAKKYYDEKDYNKVYSELSGMKLTKETEKMYNQSALIVILDKQYKSYEDFMKLKEYDEALYSLVKGTQKYDEGKDQAAELGIQTEFDAIYIKINQALQDTFKINADTVRQWDTIKIKADYQKTILDVVNQVGLIQNQ